jgi:hypothetical protein
VLSLSPLAICGQVACWKRPGRHWFDDRFFCHSHAEPSDEMVAGELVLRRLRITCDVLLTATDWRAPKAQAEGVGYLERAVAAAGGLLDVHGVLSTIGKTAAPAGPGQANGDPAGQG